jgi:CDP-paratose 2-epimerase
MRILITGVCGYVGSRIAAGVADRMAGVEIVGMDNLSRRGAETNLPALKKLGVRFYHGDMRMQSDLLALPACDWAIDCAANPTVLAGLSADSGCSPGQLLEHNLVGTLHLLEYCRGHGCGLILLSTSRVYSTEALAGIPLREDATRFRASPPFPSNMRGVSEHGIAEEFSTSPPLSLYGATKLASEVLALEYAIAFAFPLWIDRCGVIGGPGQLARIDQGIFSYWVYACASGRPLKYIGFGGEGKQVRDCVTAEDIADLIVRQVGDPSRSVPRVLNVGGGVDGALSLREVTQLCESFFGRKCAVEHSTETRLYDIPYFVTDTRRVHEAWDWKPSCDGKGIVLRLCEWTDRNRELVNSLLSCG